jgi:glycosyltransferase 2 family protein
MNRRFALIQALVSLVALAAVVWWASNQDAPQLPGTTASYAWMVGALALYAVATLLRGERWHRILHLTGVKAGRADSYALTTVGYMGNNVLPARAGEVMRVVLMSKRTGAGKREVAGTVVSERVLDAVALGVMLVVVVFAVLRGTTIPSNQPLIVGSIAMVVLAVTAVTLHVMHRRGLLTRLRDWIRPLAEAPRALLGWNGAVLLAGSFVIWASEASVYLAVAHATELDISASGALYLVALTNLFAMIPAAPGYVGTFDAAVVYGVHAIGGSKSAALSYLLLLRFILFVPITLVGLVVLVTRYGGLARARDVLRSTRTAAEPTV